MNVPDEKSFVEIEDRLHALATPLGTPKANDWLAQHHEKGQTFRQYLSANPVRRSPELNAIHVTLIGDLTDPHEQIVDLMSRYLSLFFNSPTQILSRVSLDRIPASARRKHPRSGDKQLLTSFLLHDVLEPTRPDNALAHVAVTTRDLWPGERWNFAFGQANLRRRVAVWSLHRFGYPGKSKDAFRLCLRRTLHTAAHEIGHILTMQHCTGNRCLMNGCNSLEEQDRQPLLPCPVCLRKLCWNLQVEPSPYLQRLGGFCRDQGLDEAGLFAEAANRLES
jgi:archaemetzincin